MDVLFSGLHTLFSAHRRLARHRVREQCERRAARHIRPPQYSPQAVPWARGPSPRPRLICGKGQRAAEYPVTRAQAALQEASDYVRWFFRTQSRGQSRCARAQCLRLQASRPVHAENPPLQSPHPDTRARAASSAARPAYASRIPRSGSRAPRQARRAGENPGQPRSNPRPHPARRTLPPAYTFRLKRECRDCAGRAPPVSRAQFLQGRIPELRRARGFAADIDQIGAFFDHALRAHARSLKRWITRPVEKRIRREVENAHHQRARERETEASALKIHGVFRAFFSEIAQGTNAKTV